MTGRYGISLFSLLAAANVFAATEHGVTGGTLCLPGEPWCMTVAAVFIAIGLSLFFYLDRRRNVRLYLSEARRAADLEKRLTEERTALEAAKAAVVAADRSQSLFLSHMSHEIRTPLNAIMGFTDQLRRETRDERHRRYLDIVKGASSTLLTILEDMLDLSRLESGKLQIERVDVDLHAFIEETVSLFGRQSEGREFEVAVHRTSELPAYVRTDPVRLRQVLFHMFTNVIHLFPLKERIVIDVAYQAPMLRFSVEDSGNRLDRLMQQKIFSPFAQVETSAACRYEGIGLGLSICKRLVELLGGRILTQSAPEEEGRFGFDVEAPVVVTAPAEPSLHVENPLRGHILVAEDIATNRMLIEMLLDELGLEHTVVNDGDEAITAVRTQPYDMILMDINMPNRDGVSATRVIRNELQGAMPIVALTANAMPEEIATYKEAGMQDVLLKPVNLEKLRSALGCFLPVA